MKTNESEVSEMKIDKKTLDMLSSLPDDKLWQVLNVIASSSGISLVAPPNDKEQIARLREAMGSVTENDLDRAEIDVSVGNRYAADSYESYLLKGEFRYTGAKPFGILLGYGDDAAAYRYVGYDPAAKTLGYRLPGKTVNECEYRMDLEENTEYSFTYIQEGSVGALYIDGAGALSFRTYGTSNKKVAFFSEGAQFRVGGLSQWIRSKKA